MTLEQLRIFLAVAEREHVTRAAEALNLTQSAVSGAIRTLERRNDIVLFDRVARRVELTHEGRVFLEKAKNVLRAAKAAEAALRELRDLQSGVVFVHASQTTGSYWLPPRLARFRARYPKIDVRLALGNTEQVAAAVLSGDAEIGYVEGDVHHEDLTAQIVQIDRLVIVVGRNHPWFGLDRLLPARLLETPWILRERGSGTRAAFEDALRRLNIDPSALDVLLELPSNEAVRSAAEASGCATAISFAVVEQWLTGGRLRALSFDLERPFTVLTHRERVLTNAAKAFLNSVAHDMSELAEAPSPISAP